MLKPRGNAPELPSLNTTRAFEMALSSRHVPACPYRRAPGGAVGKQWLTFLSVRHLFFVGPACVQPHIGVSLCLSSYDIVVPSYSRSPCLTILLCVLPALGVFLGVMACYDNKE